MIPEAVRRANAEAILRSFPALQAPLDRESSLVFATSAAGDYVLGPVSGPARVELLTFVAGSDTNLGRNFSLYISLNDSAVVASPPDVNILDPLSPSDRFLPALSPVTVPVGFLIHAARFWIKLTVRGVFDCTVWLLLAKRR